MREILTEGQKLKRIRDKIGAIQQAIAGKYTRNYYGDYEKDKVKLSEHIEAAQEFCKNINDYIDSQRPGWEHITLEYLIETEEQQANRFIMEITKEINGCINIEELIKEAAALIIRFGISKTKEEPGIKVNLVSELYSEISQYYHKKHEYKKEQEHLFKKLALYFNRGNVLEMYDTGIKIMKNNYMQGKYDGVIRTGSTLFEMINAGEITDAERIARAYINTALAYKGEENYLKCIEIIEEMEGRIIIPDIYKCTVNTLKSNCYVFLGRYNEAIQIYLSELNEDINNNGDKGAIANNYANTSYAYLKLENKDKAIEYIQRALSLIEGIGETYRMNIYYNALEVYSYIGDKEKSYHYFDLGLTAAQELKSKDKMRKIFKTMFEFCIKYNLNDKLFQTLEQLENKICPEECGELAIYYIKISAYFRRTGDMDKFFYTFDKGANILDKPYFNKNGKYDIIISGG